MYDHVMRSIKSVNYGGSREGDLTWEGEVQEAEKVL